MYKRQVECYLVEWNGRYCVQLSAMYDRDYAEDLGMGYPEPVSYTHLDVYKRQVYIEVKIYAEKVENMR